MIDLALIAGAAEVRTDRYLYPPYERERFSGGVNLSAQARNAAIDAKAYSLNYPAGRVLVVSPRALAFLRKLNVT